MASDLFHKIDGCRVCGNKDIITVLDLGDQFLSGIFPKKIDLDMPRGPLKLVKCNEEGGGCGHVQLEHTYDLPTMYGDNYGYRSGLNASMVDHLKAHAEMIDGHMGPFNDGDIIVDIAGNDGTFLKNFRPGLRLLSIDPTSKKFSKYFEPHINYVADFFSADLFREQFGEDKAKIITSFSMFYDLDDPVGFAKQVKECLSEAGVWVLEQSYMPEMLRQNSFDTVCHEHLSYYGLRQLKYIMDNAGLEIIDYFFNDTNGGSIVLIVSHQGGRIGEEDTVKITGGIGTEIDERLDTVDPWLEFKDRMDENGIECKKLLTELRRDGYKVAALGASTKGNVTLQTWGITANDILAVGDVNPDKHGSLTPGTWIPIRDEDEVLAYYDAFVVLPWHFKEFFIKNPKFKGKKLIFPLPTLDVVVP